MHINQKWNNQEDHLLLNAKHIVQKGKERKRKKKIENKKKAKSERRQKIEKSFFCLFFEHNRSPSSSLLQLQPRLCKEMVLFQNLSKNRLRIELPSWSKFKFLFENWNNPQICCAEFEKHPTENNFTIAMWT